MGKVRLLTPVAIATLVASVAMAPPARAGEGGIAAGEGAIVGAGTAQAIEGRYIVVLKSAEVRSTTTAAATTEAIASTLTARYGGRVEHVYSATITGFAAAMSERDARRLAVHPAVAYVAQDQMAHALDVQTAPPSWGLDRIDQRDLPFDQSYLFSTTASNVNTFVLDTGIRSTHQDFGGRVRHGPDFIDNDNDSSDCNGHGTHVAGTVGGRSFGVAKAVMLWAVRVLNCQGSGALSVIIAGVDWVTRNAVRPAVANMSIGAAPFQPLDDAVQRSIDAGITYAIAAGNRNTNACGQSPARAPNAITVGATFLDDNKAGFSNIGPCLDIFAPGVLIPSAWATSDTATETISGTSMAAPHVAGAAALFLARNPTAAPRQVRDALVNSATPNKVSRAGAGSPNLLLFTNHGLTPPPPPQGCGKRTNDNDVPITDAGSPVGSLIRVAGCAGNAPSNLQVEVHIKHPFSSDLRIDLVAPDGTEYRLRESGSSGGRDIDQTFRVNASSETNNGSWVLKVQDRSEGDAGFIDSWSLFPQAG